MERKDILSDREWLSALEIAVLRGAEDHGLMTVLLGILTLPPSIVELIFRKGLHKTAAIAICHPNATRSMFETAIKMRTMNDDHDIFKKAMTNPSFPEDLKFLVQIAE